MLRRSEDSRDRQPLPSRFLAARLARLGGFLACLALILVIPVRVQGYQFDGRVTCGDRGGIGAVNEHTNDDSAASTAAVSACQSAGDTRVLEGVALLIVGLVVGRTCSAPPNRRERRAIAASAETSGRTS